VPKFAFLFDQFIVIVKYGILEWECLVFLFG